MLKRFTLITPPQLGWSCSFSNPLLAVECNEPYSVAEKNPIRFFKTEADVTSGPFLPLEGRRNSLRKFLRNRADGEQQE